MRIFEALEDRFLEKFTLSLSLTGALYLYSVYREVIIEQVRYVLSAGSENFATSLNLLMQQYMNNVFPIIIFWLLLGVLCYFFYFLVQNIYYHFENAVTIKLFFTKPIFLRKDNSKMIFAKRILIHFLVILSFVLLAIFTTFGLIPVVIILQRAIESISASNIYLLISVPMSILYWYLVATIIHMVAVRLNSALVSSELEAEHKTV